MACCCHHVLRTVWPCAPTRLQGGAAVEVGPAGFPLPPEFCAFLTAHSADLGIPFPITAAMLGDLGLQLSPAVATAFLEAVGGRLTVPAAA